MKIDGERQRQRDRERFILLEYESTRVRWKIHRKLSIVMNSNRIFNDDYDACPEIIKPLSLS